MSHARVQQSEVVDVLRALGGHAVATRLCRALVERGHQTGEAQLAMQRATDSGGPISIERDWSLRLVPDLPAV